MSDVWKCDWMQAGARGEQLAEYVREQGHEAALTMHDNTDKAAEMLTDAARKVRVQSPLSSYFFLLLAAGCHRVCFTII